MKINVSKDSWFFKVVAGALIAAIFAWGGQWFGHIESSVQAQVLVDAKQETRLTVTEKRVDEIRPSLDRIEAKIDKVVERELTKGK